MTRRRKVLTTEERTRVVERYTTEQVTISVLAADFGVHGTTIIKILQDAGASRGKGNRVPRK